MKTDIAAEAAKGTPAVAGTVYSALTLNEVVAIITAVYVVVQILYLLRKWFREEQDRRKPP